MGVYSSDSITKHINFYDIIKEKRAKYPFRIFNTNRENKPGTYWWSFLDIHPKKIYCYLIVLDLLGLNSLLQTMIKIIDKMLLNLEKFNKKTQKPISSC